MKKLPLNLISDDWKKEWDKTYGDKLKDVAVHAPGFQNTFNDFAKQFIQKLIEQQAIQDNNTYANYQLKVEALKRDAGYVLDDVKNMERHLGYLKEVAKKANKLTHKIF